MKLWDILLDKFIETSLFEMAYSRKKAWQIVNGQSFELVNYIIKMIIMPNAQYWDHWRKEINGWIRNIRNIRLKPKNKPLAKYQIIEWLIHEPDFNIKRMANQLVHDYFNDNVDVPQDLNIQVQNVLAWIINEIVRANNENSEEYIDIRRYFK